MEATDWDALKQQMDSPYGVMRLQCDQFEVMLAQVTDTRSKSWKTAVYVDGVWKGAWLLANKAGEPMHEEARRFLRRTSKALYSRKEVEAYRKGCGKREAERVAALRMVMFEPTWKSFTALKKHLLANNASIARLD